METIKSGVYRHYKGGLYFVICVTERTEEPGFYDVTYKDAMGKHWSRPLSMWNEVVNGQPRFTYCPDLAEANKLFATEMEKYL